MILDCNNVYQILDIVKINKSNTFIIGDMIFDNIKKANILHICTIINDNTNIIDIKKPHSEKRIHKCEEFSIPNQNKGKTIMNIFIIKKMDFINMIKEFNPFIIECLFSDSKITSRYLKYLPNDNNKIIDNFIELSEKHWEDSLIYASIRILKIAYQIIVYKSINASEYSYLWSEIQNDINNNKDYDFFNSKYREIFEEYYSDLKKLYIHEEPLVSKKSKKKSRKKNKKNIGENSDD